MNLKNIIAAVTVIAATTTSVAAMADVRVSGSAQVQVQGTTVIRDHRTEQPIYRTPVQPVIVKPAPVIVKPAPVKTVIVRDHRTEDHRNTDWNHIHPIPAPRPPVVVVTQPVVYQPPAPVPCETPTYTANLQVDNLFNGESIDLANWSTTGINSLTLDWSKPVAANTTVTVYYTNGITKTYNMDPHPSTAGTFEQSRFMLVDHRPISRITVSGTARTWERAPIQVASL